MDREKIITDKNPVCECRRNDKSDNADEKVIKLSMSIFRMNLIRDLEEKKTNEQKDN